VAEDTPSPRQPSNGTPSVTIVLAIEAAPRIIVDAVSDAEFLRLQDWLDASGHSALIDEADRLREAAA
jgi:hypothetical protein